MDQINSLNIENHQELTLVLNVVIQEEHVLEKGDLDCIPIEVFDNIFKFLSPNDLATVSLTCCAMKDLTESYFVRKVRCGRVKIELQRNGKIVRWGSYENFEIRFGSLIDGIHLSMRTLESIFIRKLFQFIKLKCSQRIRRLQINFPYYVDGMQFSIDDIELIAEKIKYLNRLVLMGPPFLEGFLKYCKQLETLCVLRPIKCTQDDWTNTVNSHLKIFILIDSLYLSHQIDLIHFLSNAPQLQAIGLNNLSAIRSFLNSNNKVSSAEFWFKETTDLIALMDDIEKCCKQNRIGSLHLGVFHCKNGDNMIRIFNKIRHLPMVRGFHFGPLIYLKALKNAISQPYLETLCFHMHVDDIQFIDRLIELFPKLHELHIVGTAVLDNPFGIKKLFTTIASQFRCIKRLNFLFLDGIRISNDDLIEINANRLKLQDSSFLTIQTNTEVIDTKLDKISIVKTMQPNCLSCRVFCIGSSPDYEDISTYLQTLPFT